MILNIRFGIKLFTIKIYGTLGQTLTRRRVRKPSPSYPPPPFEMGPLFDIAATEGVSLFRPQEDCLLNSELIREGALFQTMSMEQHLTEQLN